MDEEEFYSCDYFDSEDSVDEQSEDAFDAHEILTIEDAECEMKNSIKQVDNVITIPSVRLLLNHFEWDELKLIERLFSDREALFKEARVINPDRLHSEREQEGGADISRSTQSEECSICITLLKVSTMTGIGCGHVFCTDCWTGYLTFKIMDDGTCRKIECPAGDCNILVDDETVMKIITDGIVKSKYQRLITCNYIECNRQLKWCPAPNCDKVVKAPLDKMARVVCTCGHNFCFKCRENWHEPVQCDRLKKWSEKCTDDSETSNWIKAYTKKCPNCGTSIEKNGGCNDMLCINKNCQAVFCWACLVTYTRNADHVCSHFKEPSSKVKKVRLNHKHYLFHERHYRKHMQSLHLEKRLYKCEGVQLLQQITDNKICVSEPFFWKRAVDTLCECRVTLTYAYVFVFFLAKNNQTEIFKTIQADLETSTEALSGYLENGQITSENASEVVQSILFKAIYCEDRRVKLLGLAREGYEKQWWQFVD